MASRKSFINIRKHILAQGKAFDKDKVLETLRPYFQLGCSIPKACAYAGIRYEAVWKWIKDDEELRIQITAWQNEMNTIARKVYLEKMRRGDFQAADKWLSKKEKDEFSDRTEVTGKDGEPIVTGFNYVIPDEQDNSDDTTAS